MVFLGTAMTQIKILRKQSVLDTIGVSSATLWRMCRDGRFPKPIKLGPNSVGWVDEEVQNRLIELIAERDKS